jgi:hypothetical protein
MDAPLNIAQFNALLHEKRGQSELMSALSELTTVRDLEVLGAGLIPTGMWGGW